MVNKALGNSSYSKNRRKQIKVGSFISEEINVTNMKKLKEGVEINRSITAFVNEFSKTAIAIVMKLEDLEEI